MTCSSASALSNFAATTFTPNSRVADVDIRIAGLVLVLDQRSGSRIDRETGIGASDIRANGHIADRCRDVDVGLSV